MARSAPDVTTLLLQWQEGQGQAFDQLLPLVYEELRRLAHRYLWHERPGHTLRTTDLVHEAYLNLAGNEEVAMQNRVHFFAIAARVMRHVLIDYARRRNRVKRGGGQRLLTLDESQTALFSDDHLDHLLGIDEALGRLEAVDPRASQIVECRYFGGLTIEETAGVLDISPATVKRDWAMAKAWLRRELLGES